MLGIWALELGDADCYNDDGVTSLVISQVADQYRAYDMPGGWILPNDGYGCGYTNLPYVVSELWNRGFYTGLWTEDGVDQIAWEVGIAGTRVQKLDVAWTGAGYQHSLDANMLAWEGIYDNSDSRPFVWTVMGWAGTQRYSVAWTGDQYGTWDLIRWHIPTLIGSGLCGQAYATTDVDGIFGGSPETFTRDLQWKCFTPVMYVMNGWSSLRKSPWWYDDPYRSINRDYLKRKMRMTPYIFKYVRDASQTGEPIVRGLMWDYPDDTVGWTEDYKYQYMLGDWILVAPIYTSMSINEGYRNEPIYVPEGRFVDYWDGRYVDGPTVIEDYPITLEKLPVLIKGGAIIPMYPSMLYNDQLPKDPLTFDIYPYGNTSFTMYEDDGKTRDYASGEYATQLISVTADTTNAADITIDVAASVGTFDGKLSTRVYEFEVHYPLEPLSVSNGSAMTEHSTLTAHRSASSGWFYDANEKGGIVYIKLPSQSTSSTAQVVLNIDESDTLPDPEPYPAPPITDKLNKSEFIVSSTSPAQSGMALSNAFDGTLETMWHTQWTPSTPQYPHEVFIDLTETYYINKFAYTPRTDAGNGTIVGYELYVTNDDANYGTAVSTGSWAATSSVKTVSFTTKLGRYIKFVATAEKNGNPWASAAEFDVYQDTSVSNPDPGNTWYVKLIALSEWDGGAWASMAELNVLSNGSPISQSGWSLESVSSAQSGNGGALAFDGSSSTMWHTQWTPTTPTHPHEIVIDLGDGYDVTGFRYLPRQTGDNGWISSYEFYVSENGTTWGAAVATGAFAGNSSEKEVTFVDPEPTPATMNSPSDSSTFTSTSVIFTWTNDGLAGGYQLMLGTTVNGNDIHYSGILSANDTSHTVSGLPDDGSTIYGSLRTDSSGTWVIREYVYTAYNTGSPVAPTITSHPQNATVIEGNSVNFSVTATGSDTLTYQWRKDGSNISGATSVLFSIDSCEQSDEADYSVVVSNSAGSDTSNNATLVVDTVSGLTKIHDFPLSTSPGWSTEGQWAYGQPSGQGGDHGGVDPTSGYTGSNVYGYNLSGDYASDLSPQNLTTGAIDLSNKTQTELRFKRWLGVEKSQYDHAKILISTDNANWSEIFANPYSTAIEDTSWNSIAIDISAYADNQSTVYIRWVMGSSDGSWQYCGWNIDDAEIWGNTSGPSSTVFSDNFETNKGWTVNPNSTDDANTGMWERANPEATSSSGVDCQLGATVSGVYDLVRVGS